MSKSETERLEDLEVLAAHQARTLDELNDVIVEQGRTISSLRRKLEALTSQMDDLAEAIPVEKPPHW